MALRQQRGGGPGNRGGGGGGGGGGFRGGGRGGGSGGPRGDDRGSGPEKRRELLDLGRFVDKRLVVKFSGGREVVGTLKGFDQLLNLVLDDTQEYLRGVPAYTAGSRKKKGGGRKNG